LKETMNMFSGSIDARENRASFLREKLPFVIVFP